LTKRAVIVQRFKGSEVQRFRVQRFRVQKFRGLEVNPEHRTQNPERRTCEAFQQGNIER